MHRIRENFGKHWKNYKARVNVVFPEFFPAFANFDVDNGKIYVFLHPAAESHQEVLVLDLKGKRMREIDIPLIGSGISSQVPLIIKNEKIFFMHDNEKTEKWEIRFERLYK